VACGAWRWKSVALCDQTPRAWRPSNQVCNRLLQACVGAVQLAVHHLSTTHPISDVR
jgi:hypothetical protein